MIVGHYATALLPWSRLRGERVPFWVLLLCANVPEFLWLALALAGVEAPSPANLLDATFQNLRVDMVYSHNLVPALVQAALTGGIVFAFFRRARVALWCAGLVLVHVLCDYLVGFEHQLCCRDSMSVALDSYGKAPHLAILFELAFSVVFVALYHRAEARAGRPVSPKRRLALHAAFAIGVLLWLPNATESMRSVLGL